MKAKLHIFLGAGGVGKTTLSSSFALSLARTGRRVALMSIDPAKRLQSALKIEGKLGDHGTDIPIGTGVVRAYILNPSEALKRWAEEKQQNSSSLFANPYFEALSERLASSTDTLAAVRIGEWLQKEGDEFDDLVIDTAPGIHALDFLSGPERLLSFLDGKLIQWVQWFVEENADKKEERGGLFRKILRSGTRRLLEGFTSLGGKGFLLKFGEFLFLARSVFSVAMNRLEVSIKWIHHPSTAIYLICAVRHDAFSTTKELAKELKKIDLKVSHVVLNRFLSLDQKEFSFIPENESEKICLNFLVSYNHMQQSIERELSASGSHFTKVPALMELEKKEVEILLDDLANLGDRLTSL